MTNCCAPCRQWVDILNAIGNASGAAQKKIRNNHIDGQHFDLQRKLFTLHQNEKSQHIAHGRDKVCDGKHEKQWTLSVMFRNVCGHIGVQRIPTYNPHESERNTEKQEKISFTRGQFPRLSTEMKMKNRVLYL